jgi:uncharacterized membrane protein
MMSQNRQQDIDRKAAENDYRINVKGELEIELLHDKIDQLRRMSSCSPRRSGADRALAAVDRGRESGRRARRGRRTAVITRGYRIHGLPSFPIR